LDSDGTFCVLAKVIDLQVLVTTKQLGRRHPAAQYGDDQVHHVANAFAVHQYICSSRNL